MQSLTLTIGVEVRPPRYCFSLPITIERAQSHLNRKHADIDCGHDRENDLLSGLLCRTPARNPDPLQPNKVISSTTSLNTCKFSQRCHIAAAAVPPSPQGPDCLRILECLFQEVQGHVSAFVQGSFYNRGRDEIIVRLHFVCGCLIRETMERTCYAFHSHQPVKASNLLSEGFVQMQNMVEFHSIASTFYLIGCIALLLSQRQNQIAACLSRQVYHMSYRCRSKGNPGISGFRRVFFYVGVLSQRSDSHKFFLLALRSLTDSFDKLLGPNDPLTISSACMQS